MPAQARVIALTDTFERAEESYPRLASMPPVRHPLLKAFEQAESGQLLLKTPEGHTHSFGRGGAGQEAHLRLHSWQALDALLSRGEIGFAEAYMDGLWETDDLPSLLTFGLANANTLENYFYGRPLYALWTRSMSMLRGNSIRGSRRNIMKHYDLGNEFYELWLDKSMTYSGAIFGNNRSLSLEEAQQTKYHRILDKLDSKPGDHILEIGCGWGGFAEAAARESTRVTGVTISEAQKAYADERLFNAGLDDLATIELIDYRKVEGQFDHIVSIGMFEHVGEKYWPTYFDTIKSRLKPGGKAMVQTITIDDEIFERTRGKYGFIETYIFPGGLLPSKTLFRKAAEDAGLKCCETFSFGQDYALTLTHWLERFNTHENDIKAMGYGDDFIRMWRMYLASCIAAFTTGRTDVMQAELMHA